MINISKLHRAS